MLKTQNNGELSLSLKGKEVTLAGWVETRRDHGKLVFIDLRDSTGIVQIVFLPNHKEVHKEAQNLGNEFVIQIMGKVNERPEGMKNKKITTGEIEVEATELKILSKSKTPPFEIDKDTIKVNEEKRLEYRYLDLRSKRMAKNIKIRFAAIQFIRNYLGGQEFIEVQTPMLSKSTPEGARDYLVPSRLHRGNFFALPQ